MSEKIVAGNLDEVIGKNVEIRDEMREKALLIRTNWNRMQISYVESVSNADFKALWAGSNAT